MNWGARGGGGGAVQGAKKKELEKKEFYNLEK